jgi:hypothetical protein
MKYVFCTELTILFVKLRNFGDSNISLLNLFFSYLDLKRELGLEGGATSFHYLSQGKTVTIENVDDAKGFEEVCKAMNTIEVSPQEQVQKSILLLLLHS